MLSQHSINGCGRALQWFYTIGISPLRWDPKYQRIEVAQSTLRLLVLALNVCLYALYGLNNTRSLVERSVNDSFFGKSDLAFNFLWFCCFNTTIFAAWSTLKRRNGICGYINQFIQLHKRLSVEYNNKTHDRNWLDQVIDLVLPWVAFNTSVLFATYILDMANPRYFYNRVGRMVGLCALLELGIYLQLYFIICLYWGFLFVLVPMVTSYWLRNITRGTGASAHVAADVRSYQLLQLLNHRHNDCFARVPFPSFILCGVSCHAFCIYLSTMHHDQISPPALFLFGSWAIVWGVIQMAVYTVMGKYQGHSEEVKRHCTMRCRTKLQLRKVWALRPLKVQVGEAQFVHRDTALGIILIVSNVTINSILII